MQLVSIFAFVVLGSLLPATNSVKYNLKKCTTFNEVDNNVSNDGAYFSRLLIAGSHSFAINLLKALHKFEAGDSAGILFSPYSVWSALVVTLMGAKNETETEIKNALKVQNVPKNAVGMAYQGLRFWYQLKSNLTKAAKSKKTNYYSANKIFYNDQLQLDECIGDNFGGDMKEMDFGYNPVDSADTINEWVENATQGKIKDLVSHDSVTPWTTLIIVNALYFQSQWQSQFEAEDTRKAMFHVSPAEEHEVDMMSQTGTFMFGVSERLQSMAIDLPYANGDFSMLLILPERGRGIDSVIKYIYPSDIYELLGTMYDEEVMVSMPKFKFEQDFELAGPLFSMGIKKIFDPRYCDLSGFFTNVNDTSDEPMEKATLNSVIHRSYISVNEEGTEAAAATAMLLGRSGRPAFPAQFIADRPFLYLIRDTATNIFLFMGVVRRP